MREEFTKKLEEARNILAEITENMDKFMKKTEDDEIYAMFRFPQKKADQFDVTDEEDEPETITEEDMVDAGYKREIEAMERNIEKNRGRREEQQDRLAEAYDRERDDNTQAK